MKKIYRSSQKKDVLGYHINGLIIHKYGLPYRNAFGHIFPQDLDSMDLMFVAVEKHPEIHIVTGLNKAGNYMTLNRYESKNADVYHLYTGNADPEIEFTDESSIDDWTVEELEAQEKFFEEFRNSKYSPLQIAAINFAIDAKLKVGS